MAGFSDFGQVDALLRLQPAVQPHADLRQLDHPPHPRRSYVSRSYVSCVTRFNRRHNSATASAACADCIQTATVSAMTIEEGENRLVETRVLLDVAEVARVLDHGKL